MAFGELVVRRPKWGIRAKRESGMLCLCGKLPPMKRARDIVTLLILLNHGIFAQQSGRPPEEAACGPAQSKLRVHTDKKSHSMATPEAGQALVYIIQDELHDGTVIVGCGVLTRYGLDGKWIGGNCGKSYFSAEVAPGEHHLCGEWQLHNLFQSHTPVSLYPFAAKSGETYFFRAQVVIGKPPYGFHTIDLRPINSDEGRLLIQKSGLSSIR